MFETIRVRMHCFCYKSTAQVTKCFLATHEYYIRSNALVQKCVDRLSNFNSAALRAGQMAFRISSEKKSGQCQAIILIATEVERHQCYHRKYLR